MARNGDCVLQTVQKVSQPTRTAVCIWYLRRCRFNMGSPDKNHEINEQQKSISNCQSNFQDPRNGFTHVSPCSTNHHHGPWELCRSTACKTWTAAWVNPWAGMVGAPVNQNPWVPWVMIHFTQDWPYFRYIETPCDFPFQLGEKFDTKYPSGTRMVDRNCETASEDSEGGQPHDQRPVDPVDCWFDWSVVGNYEPT